MTATISEEHPLTPDLALLFDRHTADMHAQTPPESIYMMDKSALAAADARFFVLREAGTPLAMGALKRITPDHAEIKSMHVLSEARGRGLSSQMLAHLIAAAQGDGYGRLSLETGREEIFTPARRLYEKAGFTECEAFGDYSHDPNSLYMTRAL
ncbi:GNAT family N-acetyltransferase [Gemmobacter sp. 24YEA27]|uniref:GNAT family N-acetyltransferase n=1 Tax=Gemmobacter sp. 24YEA27 TaxID=3040672 RepID=UPI0024B327EE|nr:GNAT family N-acetyltransferase [Gemmobacter sp. 24YEA27]